MIGTSPQNRFPFIGDALCLDFVNTEVIVQDERVDLLGGFDDLIDWYAEAGVVDTAQATAVRRRAAGGHADARALKEARHFRAALREVVERLAAGRGRTQVTQGGLDHLNRVLRAREGYLEVVRTPEGYATQFRPRLDEPGHLLAAVAESAARLLGEGDPAFVRKCGNPHCILYFYDTTKNHRRRWCSMAGCGNRAKVAAFYLRSRKNGDDD